MSTVAKKALNVKINGNETTVDEGTVVLEVCKQNDVEVSNDAVVAEVNGSNITVDKLYDEIQFVMKQFRVTNKNDLT